MGARPRFAPSTCRFPDSPRCSAVRHDLAMTQNAVWTEDAIIAGGVSRRAMVTGAGPDSSKKQQKAKVEVGTP